MKRTSWSCIEKEKEKESVVISPLTWKTIARHVLLQYTLISTVKRLYNVMFENPHTCTCTHARSGSLSLSIFCYCKHFRTQIGSHFSLWTVGKNDMSQRLFSTNSLHFFFRFKSLTWNKVYTVYVSVSMQMSQKLLWQDKNKIPSNKMPVNRESCISNKSSSFSSIDGMANQWIIKFEWKSKNSS